MTFSRSSRSLGGPCRAAPPPPGRAWKVAAIRLAAWLAAGLLVPGLLGSTLPGPGLLAPPAWAQAVPPELRPTVDADAADPVILAKAAELGNDPARLFAFVRDEIRYEPYAGSLRGARGTLWSAAGNALDQASLLVALLRAAGVPARYARGTLGDDLARQVIASMFTAPLRMVGCLDPGTELANPASDPMLLAEARQHAWVQLDTGGGLQDADPVVAGATIGQAFAAVQETFAEVPDALRHKVTVALRAELSSSGASAFGLGLLTTTPFEHTFTAVELVGRPLTLGHFVSVHETGALFSLRTIAYSPYVRIDAGGSPADDTILRQGDYQEQFTNFPLASQVLTGVFLDLSFLYPEAGGQRRVERVEKVLLDRIGFAARQSGAAATGSLPGSARPAFSPLDVVTVAIGPSAQSAEPVFAKLDLVERLSADLSAMLPLTAPGDPAAQLRAVQDAVVQTREVLTGVTSLLGSSFLALSDGLAPALAESVFTRAYPDSPRAVAVSSAFVFDEPAQTGTTSIAIDILRNHRRAVAAPFQSRVAAQAVRHMLGFSDSVFEAELLTQGLDGTGAGTSSALDTLLAGPAGPHLVLGPTDLARVDRLPLSAEARARIAHALGRGRLVSVPPAMVTVNGRETIAWLEADPESGDLIAVAEDGTHGSSTSSTVAAYKLVEAELAAAEAAGTTVAADVAAFNAAHAGGNLIRAAVFRNPFNRLLGKVDRTLAKRMVVRALRRYQDNVLTYAIEKVFAGVSSPAISQFTSYFLNQFSRRMDLIVSLAEKDPPITDVLVASDPSPLLDGLRARSGSGVATELVPDPRLTIPMGGVQVPTAFIAGIKNLEAREHTFALNLANLPPGFEATTSVASVTVPPGQTAEVGICVQPVSGLPEPGTPASFTIDVASTTEPSMAATDTEPFAVPAVHGVSLVADPGAVSGVPGAPVSTTLALRAVGNVPEDITLTVDTPPGLTASDLPAVALAAGETATRILELTVAPDVPLDPTLTATVMATFGPAAAPLTQTIRIPVPVVVPGGRAAIDAAVAAGAAGDEALAAALDDLAVSIADLFGAPGDAVPRAQVLANLDRLLALFGADPGLAALAGDLRAVRDAVASGGAGTLAADLAPLAALLGRVGAIQTARARHGFSAQLLPSSQVSFPQTPVTFALSVQNRGSERTTYGLALVGLPASVTSQLSASSVTLDPGQVEAGIAITLTQTSTTALVPVDFHVQVTPVPAPELRGTVPGALTARPEIVTVASVTITPPFAASGTARTLSARILNAVNQAREGSVSYVVRDPIGAVVLVGPSVSLSLDVSSVVETVDLGALGTTGLGPGAYTVEVTVRDAGGDPIPGAVGRGTFLVGSPVTASLSIGSPFNLPGDQTVPPRLRIDASGSLSSFLTLIGQAGAAAHTVDLKDSLAYLCGPNGITVVRVDDPAHPEVVRTAGADVIVNSQRTVCRVDGERLVVHATPPQNFPFSVHVFSLADPETPQRLGSTAIPYHFANDLQVKGDHAYITTILFCFTGAGIFTHHGDLITVDISDPANPRLSAVLFDDEGTSSDGDETPGCGENGGRSNVFGAAFAGAGTLLLASTTVTGDEPHAGIGRILVVDIGTDPGRPTLAGHLDVPGTAIAVGIGVGGTRALVAGSTAGFEPFTGLTGSLVLATLDLTDPRNPGLVTIRTLPRGSRGVGFVVPLDDGRFLVPSLGTQAENARVFHVDASDAGALVVSHMDVAGNLDPGRIARAGDLVFSPTALGLLIFRLGAVEAIPVTAEVRVPTGTGVTIVPGSFSEAPDEIVSGAGFDALIWRRTLVAGMASLDVRWQEHVAGLQPGEGRRVTLDSTVDFTSQGTPGRIGLPALFVIADQVLSLFPATQTVRPNEAAAYEIGIFNAYEATVDYALAVQGVPAGWVDVPAAVTVAPFDFVLVPLTLRSDAVAALGPYGFSVTARASGVETSVLGTLVLAGDPVLPDGDARGVVATLTPAGAIAGPGTPARFTLRVTNVGSAADEFEVRVIAPPGVAVEGGPVTLAVAPGAGNARDVPLVLVPAAGVSPGDIAFTARVSSTAEPGIVDEAEGTVTVVANGVAVALSPAAGVPDSAFQMRVTNTGTVVDTFDLRLAGPAAVVAGLGQASVTLAPGAFQDVPVAVGPIDFAAEGQLLLTGTATSRGIPAVEASASAAVRIDATRGIAAGFDPPAVDLPAPGGAGLRLLVRSTGNLDDAYRATITGTTGPLTASLRDLDGLPAQSVERFLIPGLATASLFLDAALAVTGQGTVTVRVESLGDASVTAEATATVGSQSTNAPPVADAGADVEVALGALVTLDGQGSHDPDGGPGPLAFAWQLVGVPAGSAVDDGDLADAATARPSFIPDARGAYVLRLTVGDGEASASDEVTVRVVNSPPVAIARAPANAAVGEAVTLDGTDSFDPDGDLITYEWVLESAPAGSGLTTADIARRTGPDPTFRPDVSGPYVFRLVARDGEAGSAPAPVAVTAHAGNVPPNADAGPDRHAPVGVIAIVDGGDSDDPDDGPQPLAFAWTVVAVPDGSQVTTAALTGADQAQASFVPDVAGEYRLRLRVGDGADVTEDEVRLTVEAGNVTPTADAGADEVVAAGAPAILDGRDSRDPDGGPEPLAHRWRLVSRPEGSAVTSADLAGADTARPRFTPDVVGPYVLELMVFDGAAADFDNVLLVATADAPTCEGRPATIHVRDGRIVGGPDDGRPYRGLLRGTRRADVIAGTAGPDRIRARGRDDIVCGGEGDDVLEGGAGDDLLDGGPGDDRIEGQAGDDAITGGAGDDVLLGGTGDDVVDGGPGDDRIDGQAGDDVLAGGDGDDILLGGTGDDHLDGGPGANRLNGQAGHDACARGPVMEGCETAPAAPGTPLTPDRPPA